MTIKTLLRRWRSDLNDAMDTARNAREQLRAKHPKHQLLQYLTPLGEAGSVTVKFCDEFFPKELGDWKKIPVGAAILSSLEVYTQKVQQESA